MLVGYDESRDCVILHSFSSEESTTKLQIRTKYCYKTKITKKNKETKQHHKFTSEQDKRILIGVMRHGPKFDKIAKNFPCSINVVKNRYYKYLRYRWDSVLGREYECFNYPHPNLVEEQILEIERLQHQIGLDDQMQSILQPFLYKLASFDRGSEMRVVAFSNEAYSNLFTAQMLLMSQKSFPDLIKKKTQLKILNFYLKVSMSDIWQIRQKKVILKHPENYNIEEQIEKVLNYNVFYNQFTKRIRSYEFLRKQGGNRIIWNNSYFDQIFKYCFLPNNEFFHCKFQLI